MLQLDGRQNTRAGHNPNTKVWEDLSGNGNDVTLSGDYAWGSNHIQSTKALGISPLQLDAKGEITLEVTIKSLSSIYQYILGDLSKVGSNGNLLALNQNDAPSASFIYFYQASNNTRNYAHDIFSTTKLSMVCSSEKGTCTFYINGEKTETVSVRNGLSINNIICILARLDGGRPFIGNMYNALVYSTALTDAEIKHNFEIDKARFKIPTILFNYNHYFNNCVPVSGIISQCFFDLLPNTKYKVSCNIPLIGGNASAFCSNVPTSGWTTPASDVSDGADRIVTTNDNRQLAIAFISAASLGRSAITHNDFATGKYWLKAERIG